MVAVGDMVEGELIVPGQEHLIDAEVYNQVTVDAPRRVTQVVDIV